MIYRLLRAVAELIAHGVAAVTALSLFRLVQMYIEYLWGGTSPRLFGIVNIEDLMSAVNIGIFLMFVIFGVACAARAYRSND